VPLLLRLPGGRHGGERVAAQVRGIDVAPTLLALAGVAPPADFQGRSLLARLGPEADSAPWPARSERDVRRDPRPTALRDGRFKWIDGRLYDLASDPGERVDVAEHWPEVAARMAAEAEAPSTSPPAALATELSAEVQEQLRALGYLD